mmetsp:Transcript_7604/g.19621  ORF Transcript_7604/g.19621 Transcript_7604/m.19621 type:complete len:281 (-) Transcript_7604:500-1342(-)
MQHLPLDLLPLVERVANEGVEVHREHHRDQRRRQYDLRRGEVVARRLIVGVVARHAVSAIPHRQPGLDREEEGLRDPKPRAKVVKHGAHHEPQDHRGADLKGGRRGQYRDVVVHPVVSNVLLPHQLCDPRVHLDRARDVAVAVVAAASSVPHQLRLRHLPAVAVSHVIQPVVHIAVDLRLWGVLKPVENHGRPPVLLVFFEYLLRGPVGVLPEVQVLFVRRGARIGPDCRDARRPLVLRHVLLHQPLHGLDSLVSVSPLHLRHRRGVVGVGVARGPLPRH